MMHAIRCFDYCCGIQNLLKLFLKEEHVLFSIPRILTLSTRSCTLPDLFGSDSWSSFQLHKGWAGLILCMMWEESRVEKSRWFHYLGVSDLQDCVCHADLQTAWVKLRCHHISTHQCFGAMKNWPNLMELPS